MMNSNKWVSLYDPYSHPFKTPSWAYLFELANKRFDFEALITEPMVRVI